MSHFRFLELIYVPVSFADFDGCVLRACAVVSVPLFVCTDGASGVAPLGE